MPEFLKVVESNMIYEFFARFPKLPVETVSIPKAVNRVLAEELVSPEDMPPAARAVMDGYAVNAEDTFGASSALPSLLQVVGRVAMGSMPSFEVRRNQAAAIATGGFLPSGANAVVMVEYAAITGDDYVEIYKPVSVGDHILVRADDVAAGEVLLPAGHRLRAQDIGILAGMGFTSIKVRRRPRVAVISSGNEIVPIDAPPLPGQVRDINSHSISALLQAAGAEAINLGIVKDQSQLLRQAIEAGLREYDVVALSGGSSVGEQDLVVKVVAEMSRSEVLAHGVAISPGKPTLFADIAGKPFFGLPGHPVSALVTAQIFLLPLVKHLEGEEAPKWVTGQRVIAELTAQAPSEQGREEYVRVSLEKRGNSFYARPIFGKSSMISTLVLADGYFVIPLHAEGMNRGDTVEVIIF